MNEQSAVGRFRLFSVFWFWVHACMWESETHAVFRDAVFFDLTKSVQYVDASNRTSITSESCSHSPEYADESTWLENVPILGLAASAPNIFLIVSAV